MLRLRDMSRQVTRVDKVKEGTVLSRVQVQVVTGPEVEEGVLATSCMGVLQGRVADGHIVFHAAQTTYRATQSSSHAHDYCTTILYSTCDHLEATIYTVLQRPTSHHNVAPPFPVCAPDFAWPSRWELRPTPQSSDMDCRRGGAGGTVTEGSSCERRRCPRTHGYLCTTRWDTS